MLIFAGCLQKKFSNLSVDLEGLLSMMVRHPQYSCVAQIKEQLTTDGPVCKIYSNYIPSSNLLFCGYEVIMV